MPERHSDPGEQLAHAEWLREVVVRPEIERLHLVVLCLPSGQDDDRRCRPSPDGAYEIGALGAWQSEIEEHQIGT